MIALIPARGGSTGLKLKNLQLCKGKPLVSIAVEQALIAGLEPVVSTDHREIAETARNAGASVLVRPQQLASNEANLRDVAIGAANQLALDPDETMAILMPTYPTRTAEDITEHLEFFHSTIADSAVCLVPCRDHPYLCLKQDGTRWQPIQFLEYRRQERPTVMRVLHFNIAAKVGKLTSLDDGFINHTTAYKMLSHHPVDIDTQQDLERANAS